MTWELYFKLSALMFLEFAVWGAWYPVLAARLLGPLKFSGKQTAWIYAALPIACIISPLVAGEFADRLLNAELILCVCHLVGSLLLFVAAWRRDFRGLFVVILLYSLLYAATLPLVNTVMFRQLSAVLAQSTDVDAASTKIFLWAPVAWAIAGYFLTALRWIFKTEKEGRDCLVLAAVLSVVMAVVSSFMPPTRPEGVGVSEALQMLGQPSFLIFILISIVGSGMMQFYFQGTARFMQDLGVAARNVPASMALAQVAQALATWFLLGRFLSSHQLGFKWTLVLGGVCWLVLYMIYVRGSPRLMVIAAQPLHGLAYVFFIITGQIFTKNVAESNGVPLGSMQALIFAAQSGVGLVLGSQLAGVVMDVLRKEGRFRWRQIWLVPGAIMLACVVALILLFQGKT